MAERNAAIDGGIRIEFRIGINLGDISAIEALREQLTAAR
jgi:hypothetical protein